MTFDPTKLAPLMDKFAKPAELTSEYKAFQSAAFWQKVMMILGLIVMVGSLLAEAMGTDSHYGAEIGAGVAVIAKILNFFQVLGYGAQRADVKVAASESTAAVMGPPAPPAP